MSSQVETERIKKHLKITELPEIKPEDEGGVLTVVDGEWAIVVPDSEPNALVE